MIRSSDIERSYHLSIVGEFDCPVMITSKKGFDVLYKDLDLIIILNKDNDKIMVFPKHKFCVEVSLMELYNKFYVPRWEHERKIKIEKLTAEIEQLKNLRLPTQPNN